jgi:hypothetical protein
MEYARKMTLEKTTHRILEEVRKSHVEHNSLRRSKRATRKKVNYAFLDSDDDQED